MNELTMIVEKWLCFFKHAEETSEKDLHKIIGHDEIIERAYEERNRHSWNEIALRTYEQAEKYERDHIAIMDQKFDEGMEKGLKKGKEEGLAEGIEKGIAKGKIEVAKAFYLQAVDIETIAKATQLPRTCRHSCG